MDLGFKGSIYHSWNFNLCFFGTKKSHRGVFCPAECPQVWWDSAPLKKRWENRAFVWTGVPVACHFRLTLPPTIIGRGKWVPPIFASFHLGYFHFHETWKKGYQTLTLSPWILISPLPKIDGWKVIHVLFKWFPFWGHVGVPSLYGMLPQGYQSTVTQSKHRWDPKCSPYAALPWEWMIFPGHKKTAVFYPWEITIFTAVLFTAVLVNNLVETTEIYGIYGGGLKHF